MRFFYWLYARSNSWPPLRVMYAFSVAIFLISPGTAGAENDTNDEVRTFVERVNEASGDFFSSGSEADARERCRALLAWAFDVPAMGKETLGPVWDQISEEQRREFMEAFEEDIVSAYLRRMRPKGATLRFVGHRQPADGDRFAASRRSVNGKEDQTWIWRLRPDGQSWRIVDVLLNGRSAVNSQRREFASTLKSNDGDFNALISFIRKRAGQ
jgi:phospholipid transport system substrate-binding protein